ncbi:MAG: hypothetical protein AAF253_13095, partial [Pseudomonadota bacterium]
IAIPRFESWCPSHLLPERLPGGRVFLTLACFGPEMTRFSPSAASCAPVVLPRARLGGNFLNEN